MTQIIETKNLAKSCGWTSVCEGRRDYSRKAGRVLRDVRNAETTLEEHLIGKKTVMTRKQAQKSLGDPNLRWVRL